MRHAIAIHPISECRYHITLPQADWPRLQAVANKMREQQRCLDAIAMADGLWLSLAAPICGAALKSQIELALSAVHNAVANQTEKLHVIPVHYDGDDLDFIAAETGLTAQQIVSQHQGAVFTVDSLGFLPGFVYLTGLPDVLSLPRRANPRVKVEKGSVAIAQNRCCIYPTSSPGGWHIIGHSSVSLFDPHQSPPNRLNVGDTIRFEACDD